MASLNKVQIIGNLGRDPELKYMPSGDAIANLAVATSFKSKDKNTGEAVEKVEWHRVTLFGRTAEVAGQFLRKGSSVYLEGRLQTRKYTDKDGVEKYATDIICETMQMLGGKGEGEQQSQQQDRRQAPPAPAPSPREQARDRQHAASNQHQPQARPAPNFSDMDDDIPFLFSNINIRTATESRQLKRAQQGRVSSVEF